MKCAHAQNSNPYAVWTKFFIFTHALFIKIIAIVLVVVYITGYLRFSLSIMQMMAS